MDANWWNNALQSYETGRQHRADRENAQAFEQGGYNAVEQAAGARGDLQTAMTTRRFQDQQHEQAFEWFQKNAPYARNVLRYARSLQDPQQRSAFLQSQRQRFEGMGFQPDQIDQAITALSDPNTAEQAFSSYDAAFSQHEDPEWRLDPGSGQIWGVTNDGQYVEGGRGPAGLGREWREATPEELRAAGAPPGTIMDVNVQSGERRDRRNPPAGRSQQHGAPSLPSGFQWEE